MAVHLLKTADRATTTLASSYTSGATTLALTSGSLFPSTGYFYVLVEAEGGNTEELFLCSARSTNTLTVTGAQGNTSASNHASGAVVRATIWTAGSVDLLKYECCSLLSENKVALGGSSKNFKNERITWSASGVHTILDYSGGSPGYISSLWLVIADLSTDKQVSMRNSTIQIYYDGAGSPTIDCPLELFCFTDYGDATNDWATRYMGSTCNKNDCFSVYFNLPIPFNTGIKITLTNASASATGHLWSEANYILGVSNLWPRTRKLWAATGRTTNVTVDTVVTLVNVSSINPGLLAGVHLSLDSSPNSASPATAPLEGNIAYTWDGNGSPDYESSGAEDWVHHANYFQNIPLSGGSASYFSQFWTDYVGVVYASTLTWIMYRFHILDPQLFTSALKVTYTAGNSTQVNFTGGVRVAWCVLYYTE